MVDQLQELIDKQDSFEIIRDQIAAILVLETANQMQLADDGGKDPALWDLRIFSERSNPWEQYLNEDPDQTPIVNIWYDSSDFDMSGSDVVKRQKTEGIFNIDCYAYGVSADVPAGGHVAGDKDAAFNLHRALRLVRNILMASQNVYLQLRGLVWQRWPQSITTFQPQLDGRTVQQVIGARIAFKVTFNEFSPQFVPETLELLSVLVKRELDGLVVIETDYEYPLT